MPIIDYNPWSVVRQGQEAAQAPLDYAAKEAANRKARQEMADYLAEQGALSKYGQGEEVAPGIARPAELRAMYAAAPRLANQIEQNRFAATMTAHAKQLENKALWAMGEEGGGGESAPSAGASLTGGGAMPQALPGASSRVGYKVERGILPTGPYIKRTFDETEVAKAKQKDEDIKQAGEVATKNQRDSIVQEVGGLVARRRTSPPSDLPAIDAAIAQGNARIVMLDKKLGYDVAQEQKPTPVGPTTAPAAPLAQKPPTAKTETATGIASLPQVAQENLIIDKAKADMEAAKQKKVKQTEEIETAKAAAFNVIPYKSSIKDILDLVTTKDIGRPELEGVPGASNFLSLDNDYAVLSKLKESVIPLLIKPGQSQLMNTIVELMIQTARIPGIYTDPQLNKKFAANLASNIESVESFPGFAERWMKRNGSTDGIVDFWKDYVQNNQRYTTTKAPGGKVTVTENKQVKSPDEWLMRQQGKPKASPAAAPAAVAPAPPAAQRNTRMVGGKSMIEQSPGDWIEQ